MIKDIFGKIRLHAGQEMPGYGFGVYKAAGMALLQALGDAFADGYRYIDTASFYENEDIVGRGIKSSNLSRNEVFIVSKIWPTEFRAPIKALDMSLKRLDLDYLDGYLLHWPGLDRNLRLKTWEKLLREKEKGKIRILGVSNFLQMHLEELHTNFGMWPAVNQIEVHPHYQQKKLCAFCADKQIQVISWSPLGRGHAIELPEIAELARETAKSPAQVILRWHMQKNFVPIPKSIHAKRIAENAKVFDFELNHAQMEIIDSLDLPDNAGRTGKDPLKWPPMQA